MTNGKNIYCEGFECGMPLGFYTNDDIAYMHNLGLRILCIECTHAHLEANERDRVELNA